MLLAAQKHALNEVKSAMAIAAKEAAAGHAAAGLRAEGGVDGGD